MATALHGEISVRITRAEKIQFRLHEQFRAIEAVFVSVFDRAENLIPRVKFFSVYVARGLAEISTRPCLPG